MMFDPSIIYPVLWVLVGFLFAEGLDRFHFTQKGIHYPSLAYLAILIAWPLVLALCVVLIFIAFYIGMKKALKDI